MLKLMYITNNPEVALIAEKAGVDRIWIDLETLGKEERQKGMNTVKSNHTVEDIRTIAPLLSKAEMLVRVNPWHDGSLQEIDDVIDAGAELVMLPMWRTESEVKSFVNAVNKRAKVILLLETKDAYRNLDDVLKLDGIDEIHIGLNDLHLEYKMDFMFELLANGVVEDICNKIKRAGIPYGFGGVGRIGEGLLKADNIVCEHYRLGSTRVILSRAFCNTSEITDLLEIEKVMTENVGSMRNFEKVVASDYDKEMLEANRLDTIQQVEQVVSIIKQKRNNCGN